MDTSNTTISVSTVEEYLFGCVRFAVPESAVGHIAYNRNIPLSMSPDSIGNDILRLLKADLFKWIILGPSKVNNTSDSDNGWSHSDGGYTLSVEDKRMMMDEANAIYEELEPESVFGKKKVRMRSAGIMRAYCDTDGRPLPRRPL